MEIERGIVIVLDGVGIGAAPDASSYGDEGSNSIANTAQAVGGLFLPQMQQLGLGNITPILGIAPTAKPSGGFGRMTPKSAGKDTVAGHWELMGVHLDQPLPTYPGGFPKAIIDEFSGLTGKGVLGNKAASGTEIIRELGLEHIRTGKPIVYTSADSVFQIAAHEEVVAIEELYQLCEIARSVLSGENAVGRVIARPFIGDSPSNFQRTPRRKDYPLPPPSPTILDGLVAAGKEVYSVGKIDDIFGGRGITKSRHTTNNIESIAAIKDFLTETFSGLLFANLIEFDMVYGHRNDPIGYAHALETFDQHLAPIMRGMRASDLGMIVADHGVDPTTPGTDHSREYVPLLVFSPSLEQGVNLGVRKTLSDIAATISDIFHLRPSPYGESLLQLLQLGRIAGNT